MKMIPISILIPYKKDDKNLFVWMQKRASDDDLSGMLEFPGGKIESNETPELACIREVQEETDRKVTSLDLFKVYTHSYKNKTVLLNVFLFHDEDNTFLDNGFYKISVKWLEDNKETIPEANLAIFKDLFQELC